MTISLDTVARHPVLGCVDAIEEALAGVAQVPAHFMSTGEKAEALLRLTRLESQTAALRLRVIAAAEDVAAEAGCRTVADWLAVRTHADRAVCARAERLAVAVDSRHPAVGTALVEGRLSIAHAEVIVRALDALPDQVGAELRARAEARLVADAAHFSPRDLRRLGDRIVQVVAPGVADDAERRALEAAEARADAATRLTFRRRGDGATDLAARIPDAVAGRLRTYLEAFTAPRQAGVPGAEHGGWTDPATGARLSPERMAGEAFCAFIERYDPDRLPHHGGTPTTVVVTVGLDQLLHDTGVAQTSTGTPHHPR